MATANQFKATLRTTLLGARVQGLRFIDVNAGWLHRQVGQYPGPDHRMPMCNGVMRSEMQPGDSVLNEPQKGQGASLTIRYEFPRSLR